MNQLLLGSTCVAALCCIATPAAAQDAPSAPATAPSVPASGEPGLTQSGIADIVVTANRRSESLQHAPVAVSAITGDALRDAGITKPTELTAAIPALQVAVSAGPYSIFYLRGVGNFNGNALSDSAVAFNFNGVYVGRPSATTGYFYDLERVEVLKGPQGTLYGRNATGGAINVLSQAPKFGMTEASASADYGNYDAVRVDGAVNIPLGEDVALRAAGVYVRHDPYMRDGTDDQKDWSGRLSLKARPAYNLTITLVGDYARQRGTGPGSTVIGGFDLDERSGLLSPEGQSFYRSQPISVAGRNLDAITSKPYLRNESYGVSATIDWEVPVGTITIVPAYRGGKLDFLTTAPGFQIQQRETDNQYSLETRLASPKDKPLSYLFGAFYYKESNDVPRYNTNAQFTASYQQFDTDTQAMAVFGQLGYALTPTLHANLGGRYSAEDKTFAGTYFGINRLCVDLPALQASNMVQITGPCPGAAAIPYAALTPPAALIPFNPAFPQLGLNEIYGATAIFQTASIVRADRRQNFEKVTWRGSVDWQITPRNLLYASYETGFKSGGFFFSTDGGLYKPETIKAYTVGSKNRLFANRLQLNLEAFWWDYRNQQISHLSQDSGGNIVFATENVGKARFRGFEVEGQFLLTPNTLLNADVQYLDAKYQSFAYSVPVIGPPPASGCRLTGVTTAQYRLDCSGLRPPNAPEWTVNLGAQQTIPLANTSKFVIRARGHYQTETLTGLEFLAVETQKAYWLADAEVAFHAPHDQFYVAGYINNIFDETVIGNTFPPALTSFIVGSLRPPRTYGIRAGVNFR